MELTGQIERVTYTSEETGYTVARVKVYGQRDLVTVVGNIMSPTPGETLKMSGEWGHHPSYGEQFKIKSYRTEVPATSLRHPEIPGVGSHQGARAQNGGAASLKNSANRRWTSSSTRLNGFPVSTASAKSASP
jgi:hypothetical protein